MPRESCTARGCGRGRNGSLSVRRRTSPRSGLPAKMIMIHSTDDTRIKRLRPLIPPAILLEELPLQGAEAEFVSEQRRVVGDVITGRDRRLLVVVGPCSIHDPAAGLEYAERLKGAIERYADELVIVMR